MGMSNDYTIAEEGATFIRIGTKLVGEKPIKPNAERQQRVTQNEENQNRNMQQQPIERTQNNQNHLKLYLKRKYQKLQY